MCYHVHLRRGHQSPLELVVSCLVGAETEPKSSSLGDMVGAMSPAPPTGTATYLSGATQFGCVDFCQVFLKAWALHFLKLLSKGKKSEQLVLSLVLTSVCEMQPHVHLVPGAWEGSRPPDSRAQMGANRSRDKKVPGLEQGFVCTC